MAFTMLKWTNHLLMTHKQHVRSSSFSFEQGFHYRKWGRGSSTKWGGAATGSNEIPRAQSATHCHLEVERCILPPFDIRIKAVVSSSPLLYSQGLNPCRWLRWHMVQHCFFFVFFGLPEYSINLGALSIALFLLCNNINWSVVKMTFQQTGYNSHHSVPK